MNQQTAVPFGKYLLLRRLAVGGMAELFLARDEEANRLVVIKRILPYLSTEAEFVGMFLDEARIAAQLHHPNIVQVFELGKMAGSIFIVMEYLSGADLRRIVQQEANEQKLVPLGVAAWVAAQVCAGLHYAHTSSGVDGKRMEVVHRDISPQNVMVGLDGQVRLVDFGIAKASAVMERSKPGVIKGKFLYLSPEQVTQQSVDHRADLFAMGTMLFEITTGKSPFARGSTEGIIYAIRTENPPAPASIRPGFPPELARIILKCLRKEREDRYQDADELRRDLETFVRVAAPTNQASVGAYVSQLFSAQGGDHTVLDAPGLERLRAAVGVLRSEGRKPTPGPLLATGRKPTREEIQVLGPEVPTLPSDEPGPRHAEPRASPMRRSPDEPSRPVPVGMDDLDPTGPMKPKAPPKVPSLAARVSALQDDPKRAFTALAVIGGVIVGLLALALWLDSGEPPAVEPSTAVDAGPRPAGKPKGQPRDQEEKAIAPLPTDAGDPQKANSTPPATEPSDAAKEKAEASAESAEKEHRPPEKEKGDTSRLVLVVFKAPSRTQITLGGERLMPGKIYPLSTGTKVIQYRCPGRKGAANQLVRIQKSAKDPLSLTLPCR
ncbi:MAG: serine/threonine protein kinase [Myxococcaceae bacterium]